MKKFVILSVLVFPVLSTGKRGIIPPPPPPPWKLKQPSKQPVWRQKINVPHSGQRRAFTRPALTPFGECDTECVKDVEEIFTFETVQLIRRTRSNLVTANLVNEMAVSVLRAELEGASPEETRKAASAIMNAYIISDAENWDEEARNNLDALASDFFENGVTADNEIKLTQVIEACRGFLN